MIYVVARSARCASVSARCAQAIAVCSFIHTAVDHRRPEVSIHSGERCALTLGNGQQRTLFILLSDVSMGQSWCEIKGR